MYGSVAIAALLCMSIIKAYEKIQAYNLLQSHKTHMVYEMPENNIPSTEDGSEACNERTCYNIQDY